MHWAGQGGWGPVARAPTISFDIISTNTDTTLPSQSQRSFSGPGEVMYLELISKFAKNFTLVVNSVRYSFPRIVIDGISYIISSLRNAETEYRVMLNPTCDTFNEIVDLVKGKPVLFCQDGRNQLMDHAAKLEIVLLTRMPNGPPVNVQISAVSLKTFLQHQDSEHPSCFAYASLKREHVNLYPVLASSYLLYSQWIPSLPQPFIIKADNDQQIMMLTNFWNRGKLVIISANVTQWNELGESFEISILLNEIARFKQQLDEDETKMDISAEMMKLHELLLSAMESTIEMIAESIEQSL
jgi:hypothetical protein